MNINVSFLTFNSRLTSVEKFNRILKYDLTFKLFAELKVFILQVFILGLIFHENTSPL